MGDEAAALRIGPSQLSGSNLGRLRGMCSLMRSAPIATPCLGMRLGPGFPRRASATGPAQEWRTLGTASSRRGPLVRPNDQRDAREVNGNGAVREDLGERPGSQSRRSDGVRIGRGTEREGDRDLVGANGARAVSVVPAA